MKNSKAFIAVLTVIVLIFSFAACSQQKEDAKKVTQAVTNENGEVVTDENGELVTEEIEAQIVTDSNGNAVTEVVTGNDGKALTTVVNNSYVNVTQNVTQVSGGTAKQTSKTSTKASSETKSGKNNTTTKKKQDNGTTKKPTELPKAPATISSLNAGEIKETSVKLSWGKVECTGYQIACSTDGGKSWTYLEKEYKKTEYTVKDLISNTDYVFRVRAYNKNSAGTKTSDWKTVKAKTKENKTARNIRILVTLPSDGNVEDTLTIEIDGKVVHTDKINCNGSVYKYTTDKKYKGEVEINVSLKNHKSSAILKTDKEECELDVSSIGIFTIEGEDD